MGINMQPPFLPFAPKLETHAPPVLNVLAPQVREDRQGIAKLADEHPRHVALIGKARLGGGG